MKVQLVLLDHKDSLGLQVRSEQLALKVLLAQQVQVVQVLLVHKVIKVTPEHRVLLDQVQLVLLEQSDQQVQLAQLAILDQLVPLVQQVLLE
jgi:hypothetical protein